jgi:hypothetical protein
VDRVFALTRAPYHAIKIAISSALIIRCDEAAKRSRYKGSGYETKYCFDIKDVQLQVTAAGCVQLIDLHDCCKITDVGVSAMADGCSQL